MRILMVCLGNICRSPLAEGILLEKINQHNLNWTVESAGTNGYHIGEAPHHLSQKVAKMNGIDISSQKARKFLPEDMDQFDYIFAMAKDVIEDMKIIAGKKFNTHKVSLFLTPLNAKVQRDVPDPWYGTENGYHEVFALLDKGCDAIIEKLK